MRFRRNSACGANVGRGIEDDAAGLDRDVAALRRGCRMDECSLSLICEECLRDLLSTLAIILSATVFRRAAFGLVGALELMISRCLLEQVLDRRRDVVRRQLVDPDHALLAIELVPRAELQLGTAFEIDADQMQAIDRDLNRELLSGTPIAAGEERRFAPVFGH